MSRFKFITFLILIFSQLSCSQIVNRTPSSKDSNKVRLFLGVDGLGYDIFEYGKNSLGLFDYIDNYGVHLSPFPSISGYVWNTMMGSAKVHGQAGRLKNLEAAFYNDYTNSIDSDPRNYFIQYSNPNFYAMAFPIQFNLYLETVGYKSANYIRKKELESIEKQIKEAQGPLISAFVAGFDGVAHLHKGVMNNALIDLDAMIKNLIAHFKEKGKELELIIVSDHGQAGRFKEGEEELPLIGVDVDKSINNAGLSASPVLQKSTDVAPAILALANYVPFRFKDRKNILKYVDSIRNEPWFSLAVYRQVYTSTEQALSKVKSVEVIVENEQGSALIIQDKKTKKIKYLPQSANPLEIDQKYCNTWLNSKETFDATKETNFPDSLFRIMEMESREEIDTSDLIVTFKDEYRSAGSLESMVTMIRTHGNLRRRSTSGIFASNTKNIQVPKLIRTKEILTFLGHEPIDFYKLFDPQLEKMSSRNAIEKSLDDGQNVIQTSLEPLTPLKSFAYSTRGLELSKFVFHVDKISEIFSLGDLDQVKTSDVGFYNLNFKEDAKVLPRSSLLPDDEVAIEGLMKSNKESSNLNSKFQLFKEKLRSRYLDLKRTELGLKVRNLYRTSTLTVKRLAMTSYSLNKQFATFFSRPNKTEIKDIRNAEEALNWEKFKQSEGASSYQEYSEMNQLARNIFNEQILADYVKPMSFPQFYQKRPKDITIVYIPGLYDSIFDGLIFSMAAASLREELGLRVIQMNLESACSSKVNAALIMKQLKDDQRQQILRGYLPSKYVLFSYSKGSVDALHSMVLDKEFTKESIKALVSIASPLHGAKIADSADVPAVMVEALSYRNSATLCKNTERAIDSVKSEYMENFWAEYTDELKDLSKYFSVSFVSEAKDSHIWMKATKAIGQFDEANDGVVTLSSSKFPQDLNASDLGVYKADHLAGRVSGDFPQKAFFRALAILLAEIDVI